MDDLATLFLFYLLFALFTTHELDAIQRHEWRIFPITRRFADEIAYPLFTAVHIPLYVLLLWLFFHPNLAIAQNSRAAFAAFAIIHAGLHWLLRHHPKYEFNNRFSWAIILSTAVVGLFYLLLAFAV